MKHRFVRFLLLLDFKVSKPFEWNTWLLLYILYVCKKETNLAGHLVASSSNCAAFYMMPTRKEWLMRAVCNTGLFSMESAMWLWKNRKRDPLKSGQCSLSELSFSNNAIAQLELRIDTIIYIKSHNCWTISNIKLLQRSTNDWLTTNWYMNRYEPELQRLVNQLRIIKLISPTHILGCGQNKRHLITTPLAFRHFMDRTTNR